MTISINNSEDTTECRHVKITIGDKQFKISQDKFDNLVVNKVTYDDSEGSISVKPSYSNEIRII